MNRLINGAIASMNSFLKLLSIRQVLIAVLASVLLLSTTACGAGSNTTASSGAYKADPSAYKNSVNNKGIDYQRELYKPTQSPKGGMNNYNDDNRYDNGTKADAKKLIKSAERNLQKKAESPQDLVKNARDNNPLGREARREATRNAGNVTEELKDDLSEGTQKGIENIKRNVEQARQSVPRVVEEAKRNAQDAGKDVQESANDLSKGIQKATGRAANAVQEGTADTIDSVRNRN